MTLEPKEGDRNVNAGRDQSCYDNFIEVGYIVCIDIVI